jgi:2-methylcitrate dehydratase PrpD
LAQCGFTAGEHSIEGPRGFAAVQASNHDLSKITAALGFNFSLRENTYKPFPCGIVNHPTIDGCIQLHRELRPVPEEIVAIRLRVAPLVLDLCNKHNITRGLEGKFSVYHGAAVGLLRGKAGLQEYTDEVVNDRQIKRVRECVSAVADASLAEDQAHIEVELSNGQKISRFVEKSLGNIHRPMTDRQLEDKFRGQAAAVLPSAKLETVIEQCWRVDELTDVGELIRATVPTKESVQGG